MIPLSLRIATCLGVALTVFHLVLSTVVAAVPGRIPPEILGRQVSLCVVRIIRNFTGDNQFVAHFLLLLGVNMIGIFYNYLADLAQRKTFSQTRRYLISLTTIEEQQNKKVSAE